MTKILSHKFYVLGFRHMEVFVERKHGILSNVQIFKTLGDETRQNMIKLLQSQFPETFHQMEDIA